MVIQEMLVKENYSYLFKNIFRQLTDRFKIDNCFLILIQEKQDYASVVETYTSLKYDNEPEVIDLSDPKQLINVMLEERQIVINEDADLTKNGRRYGFLLDNMSQEMYVPIFIHNSRQNDIPGCIYFSSEKSRCRMADVAKDPEFNDFIFVISALFNSIYCDYRLKNDLFTYLHIVSQIYNNHCQRIDHPYNVAYWCLLMAKRLQFNEEKTFELYVAAVLHDVGILLVPHHIVNKAGRLSEEEYNIIKQHPVYGYNLAREIKTGISSLENLDLIVRHHHERYDGKGYPDQLKASEIPLFSRIIAIADATDAMLSERVFKSAFSLDKAISELSANGGTQFDPVLIDDMISILVKQKEDIKAVVSLVTWGSLIISTKKAVFNYQGNIIKKGSNYEFVSDGIDLHHGKIIENHEIEDCSLIIERSGKFYEFTALPEILGINKILIKDLQYKPANRYFSMHWDLTGEIKNGDAALSKIAIKKIGGSLITFHCLSEVRLNLKQVYTIKLQFENGEIVHIPGKNIRKYENGRYRYYDFEYAGLNESVRERIFKQMFKKQAELRQILWKTGYAAKG